MNESSITKRFFYTFRVFGVFCTRITIVTFETIVSIVILECLNLPLPDFHSPFFQSMSDQQLYSMLAVCDSMVADLKKQLRTQEHSLALLEMNMENRHQMAVPPITMAILVRDTRAMIRETEQKISNLKNQLWVLVAMRKLTVEEPAEFLDLAGDSIDDLDVDAIDADCSKCAADRAAARLAELEVEFDDYD